MGLTFSSLVYGVSGNRRTTRGQIAFDSSYPTGGESLTAANIGLSVIDQLTAQSKSGYVFEYDYTNSKLLSYRSAGFTPAGTLDSVTGGTPAGTNSAPGFTGTAPAAVSGVVTDNDNAATLGHAIYVVPLASAVRVPDLAAETGATGLVKDSDTAAADGVAIYVVVDDANWSATYQLGHLEFVSPTNANGSCTIANGAETLRLFDDDAAASNGVAIRAVAASGGLEATTAASKDILVPTSSGKYIHINHATTGATPELYFDEDAANTYDRIQGVIVDNADEPYKLFVDTGEKAPAALNQASPRLAVLVTSGPKPFTFLVGATGPELTIASRPDAASLVGAVALYVEAAGAGFSAANFGKEDLYVSIANGHFLKVAYLASPTGVQVYGHPEAATGDLSLIGVIVDNADEPISTETGLGWVRATPAGTVAAPTFTGDAVSAAVLVEVANAVNLSSLTGVRFEAIGA